MINNLRLRDLSQSELLTLCSLSPKKAFRMDHLRSPLYETDCSNNVFDIPNEERTTRISNFEYQHVDLDGSVALSPSLPSAEGVLPSPLHGPFNRVEPERLQYDVPPAVPLRRPIRRILEVTELPFLILWVFFTYWLVILGYSFRHTTMQMWLSAVFAGVLVGLALNANAYKYIVKPKSRNRKKFGFEDCTIKPPPDFGIDSNLSPLDEIEASNQNETYNEGTAIKDGENHQHLRKMVVRFPRFFSQLVASKRPFGSNKDAGQTTTGQASLTPNTPALSTTAMRSNHKSFAGSRHAFSSGMNSLTRLARDWSNFSETLEWTLDIPTIVRFFIIPFAVSALSGMTSDEDKYILVFPKNPVILSVALIVPAIWTLLLVITRLALLHHLKVVWRWKIIILNGCLIH